MVVKYTIFDIATEEVLYSLTDLPDPMPSGTNYVEGVFAASLYKITNGSPPTPYLITAPKSQGTLKQEIVIKREQIAFAGFDYDFEDVRGIIHICLDAAHMNYWNELSTYALRFNPLNPLQDIRICIDDINTIATAGEWVNDVLPAIMEKREAIYKKAADNRAGTIPQDISDSSYWIIP